MKNRLKGILGKAADFFAMDGGSAETGNKVVIPDELQHFHAISITGRYVYGHLCLNNLLDHFKCEPLPKFLGEHLRSFLTAAYLDEYFNVSYYLYGQEVFSTDNIERSGPVESGTDDTEHYVPEMILQELRRYSEICPETVSLVIDNLMWIGIANIYGGYRSEYTLPYLVSIVQTLEEEQVPLPDFKIVAQMSASDNNGWGHRTDPEMLNALLR